jgi:hypothetical protein
VATLLRSRLSLTALALGLALSAGAAQAQSLCSAPAPVAGETFRGPVLHVDDGESLCIALGDTPDRWVEVRLADAPLQQLAAANGASPRGTLMAATFAQMLTCTSLGEVESRTTAVCRLEDQPVADLLRKSASVENGRSWR